MSWTKSLLVTCRILRLFINTLTADDKYSLLSTDDSLQTIQMHLSQKQKSFSGFFAAFSKSPLNLEHFQKKTTLIASVFPKLTTPKHLLRSMSKNSRLREQLDRQYGKRAQTLIQS